MCSKNEYTKSESNSQLASPSFDLSSDCVQRTNIQNLKAIHNSRTRRKEGATIVFKERIYKIWKQFTTQRERLRQAGHCVQRTNIQNLKAIHNVVRKHQSRSAIVFKERIYKIWKQFTTTLLNISLLSPLCSKNEYTKSESNSQLASHFRRTLLNCVQRTNIQNLKAIHNWLSYWAPEPWIVFKERIYKIWKQFTTTNKLIGWLIQLCSKNEYTKSESNSQLTAAESETSRYCVQRTNIQNLKAIHNWLSYWAPEPWIVFKERIYKIWKQFTTDERVLLPDPILCSKNEYTKSESNSQLFVLSINNGLNCVQRTNIQNLKAIHNASTPGMSCPPIVFKERIYKIWKQFTTDWQTNGKEYELCSKNEYTKSESNSQLMLIGCRITWNCVQRTNIQNLKAIHNAMSNANFIAWIVFKERIYKIWKQFTTQGASVASPSLLCSKNEYTKSESNSQQDQSLCQFFAHFSCLAFSTL